jgi:hypothetical protein
MKKWLFLAAFIPLLLAFDDPFTYEHEGYHRCDAPSGWCSDEPDSPCGGTK